MSKRIFQFFIMMALILQMFSIEQIASANTSDKTSVTLSEGESYIFYNEGTALRQISTDASTTKNQLFDYATYKEDGNGYGQAMNSAGDPYIPGGGIMVVTVVSSNPVTFTYSGEDISGDVTSEPALYKHTLYKGESYTFSHNNVVNTSIQNDASSSKKFDYASYKEDGSLAGKGIAVSSEPSIPAGGQMTVTVVTDSPVTFGGYNQLFYGYVSNDPALMRITLKKGESYTFTNIGKGFRSLMNDASYKNQKLYDYAIYDKKGYGYSHKMNSQWDPNVPPGGRLVATVTSDTPVTFIYHMEFNVEPSEDPALLRQVVAKGETYSFTNYGPRSFTIRHDIKSGMKYDYAIYNADGSLRTKRANSSAQPFIPAGGRIVVTTISDVPITFGGYYEFFYADASDNPALERKTLQKGESFVLINKSSMNKQVMTDASKRDNKIFDYATYNKEGNGHYQFMNSVADPYVPPGGRIVVTVISDNPITLIYNANEFETHMSEYPALLKKTVAKGESYTFTSKGRVKEVLKNNASATRKFDYNIFNANGTLESQGINHMAENGVPAGGRIHVSNPYEEPITFFGYYDLFVGDGNSDGVSNEKLIAKGESYLFFNTGTKTKQLVSDASLDDKNKFFDYAVYKRDNSGLSQAQNVSSSIQIPPGGKAVVSVTSDQSVTFRYDNEIKAELSSKPALFKKTLEKGSSYMIFNKGTISGEYLESSGSLGRKYEYVTYKQDGSIESQDTVVATKLLVPANGKAHVTALSEQPITFWGYYDLFVGEDGTGSKPKEVIVYSGESYVFKNRASVTKELKHDGSQANAGKYFDFAAYNRDGSGYYQLMNTYGVPTIPGGGRVVVTVMSSNPVTFYYDNDIDVEPSRNPALLKQTVTTNTSYAFKNIGATSEAMENTISHPEKYDYIVYQENGTVVQQETGSTAKPKIPPKGKMVVTNTSGNPQIFWGYYEFFIGDDVNPQPSNGKQIVRQGENYVFINKGTASKVIFNNGSSNSKDKLFDYAVYKQSGAGESSNISSVDTPTIPVGGRMVVTVVSESPVTFTFDKEIEVKPWNAPALVKKTLRKDKSYLFTNKGNSEERLQTDAWIGRNYDFVLYNADGTVAKKQSNTVEKPLVQAGQRIAVIGMSDSIINFWGHYELFTVKDNDLTGKKTIYPWENYLFINNGTAPKQLPNNASIADDRYFSVAVYNKSGTGYTQKMRAAEAPYIPAGGQAVVSVHSNNPVTFTYDNDFIVEETSERSLIRATLTKGNSYEFTNIGTTSAKIMTDIAEGKQFDYTVFKADGTVQKKGTATTEEPLVPAGGKVIVTNISDVEITFGGYFRLFTGTIPDIPVGDATIYPAINKIFGPDFEQKVKAVQSGK